MSEMSIRQSAEVRYAEELAALVRTDTGPKPAGWALSPQAVRTFICGSENKTLTHKWNGKAKHKTTIQRKYYGDDSLVERCVVTLAGNRGLMLVGEPGTAKSMLSELLSAAISADSSIIIQGSAGTTEDQILYSWNYALLLAEGPSPKALVPSPIYHGMHKGRLVRFEEITRCAPEIQDLLVSVLSEKCLAIPELDGHEQALIQAKPGFNLIATANLRDRGVHEMSAALKRRFNFETVVPITDRDLEVDLVQREAQAQLQASGVPSVPEVNIVGILVDAFRDLRNGVTAEGIQVEQPSTIMSTAEAVSVCISAGIDAHYYGDGAVDASLFGKHIAGAVFKDQPEDLAKLRHYFDKIVTKRAKNDPHWRAFLGARKRLTT